ncbi:MAG: FAD:protein FMN transferase [Anaerolineales bacterium]
MDVKPAAFGSAARTSRRGFLKIVALSGLALGLGATVTRQRLAAADVPVSQATRLLMGTVVNLTVAGPTTAAAQAAVAATLAEMERLIGVLDHRRPASALGQLNATGAVDDAPPELIEVVAQALEMGALTGGAFDITIKPVLDAYRAGQREVEALRPLVDYRQVALAGRQLRLRRPGMALTLDGLAKGRVVDGGVGVLRALGYADVLVEAGGDLLAHGQRRYGQPWRVGVQSPRSAQTLLTVPVTQAALATSGDYQNSFTADFSLHHIIDPRTLRSPLAVAGATALAPTAMLADAFSTALMVLGVTDGLALVEQQPGVEALLIGKDLQVHLTAGFPGRA